jgi:hypothetical protein
MKSVQRVINYKGKGYKAVFNLNVMQDIQEKYGTLEAWGDLTEGKRVNQETGEEESVEVDIAALIFGYALMLNEGIEIDNEDNGTDNPPLTLRQVGRMISEAGERETAEAMNDLVIASVGKTEEKNG